MLNHRDCITIAGTGCGKTLCILIPLLLRPNFVSITISLLKRLQTTQVLQSERYGIKTIAINEDTPNDEALWMFCLQSLPARKSILDGRF